MAQTPKESARSRAEAHFTAPARPATAVEKAKAARKAEATVVDEKTARLKAQRLKRDEGERPGSDVVGAHAEQSRRAARVVPSKASGGFVVEIPREFGPVEVVTGFATEAEAQARADTINGGMAVD